MMTRSSVKKMVEQEQELEKLRSEVGDYRKLLLWIQRDGTDLNLRREIDEVVDKYGESGLSMREEY